MKRRFSHVSVPPLRRRPVLQSGGSHSDAGITDDDFQPPSEDSSDRNSSDDENRRPQDGAKRRKTVQRMPDLIGPPVNLKERKTKGYAIPSVPRPSVCTHGHISCSESFHTPPHPSTGLFSAPESSCSILKDLNVVFTPYGFACHTHNTLIPLDAFERHIKKHKLAQKRSIRNRVIGHLLESHRVTAETLSPEHTQDLTDTIPGLALFSAAQCPVAGCGKWFVARSSLTHHAGVHHPQLPRPVFNSLPKRYIHRPYQNIIDNKDARSRTPFFLSPEWKPPPSLPIHIESPGVLRYNTTAAPTAQFFLDIGWPQYLGTFDKSSQPLLRDLVRLRSAAEVKVLRKGRIVRFENALLCLRRLYIRYLIDIQHYNCSTNHDGVCILTQGTRAHFNPLNSLSAYVRYSRPVMQTLSMMLRYIQADRIDKGKIPQFTIPCSPVEAATAARIYDYMVSKEKLDLGVLMQLLHAFLVVMVRRKIESVNTMACPSDVALVFASLVQEDHFQVANTITLTCAILQHNWFAISMQAGRVEASGKTAFFPHSPDHFKLAPSNDTLPRRAAMPAMAPAEAEENIAVSEEVGVEAEAEALVDEEESEGEDDDDDEQDLMPDMEDMNFGDCLPELGDSNTVDEGNGVVSEVQVPSEKFFTFNGEKRTDQEASILSLLSENKMFVRPPDDSMTFSTPYTRFKFVWLKAAKLARTERRDYGFTFSADGQSVNVPDSTGTFHVIEFNQLGSIARDIIDHFTTAVQRVLPRNCANLYEEFSKLELTDDLGCRQSIFQQPANQPLLQPLIQTVYDQIMAADNLKVRAGWRVMRRNGTVDEKVVEQLLDEEQNILSLLNAAFHLSYTGGERNLFIVWGVLALANPAAKQLGAAVQECLWAFPSSLMTPVLFYLGVLRPAFAKLLGLLRSDAKDYGIYIFVHAIPKRRKAGNSWNGTNVNTSLQKHTQSLPITLTGTLLRNLTTGTIRKFFPSLTELDHLPDSLLDQQAQHRRRTGNTHYGWDFDLPRSLDMTIDRARGYIVTSQALQALYGLGIPDEATCRILSSSHIFASRMNELIAFKEARFQVLSAYLLGLQMSELNQSRNDLVRNALDRAPYMAHENGTIGDRVLRNVMHVLLFGTSRPSVGSSPPPLGYSPEHAGYAAALIIKAIKEWSLGYHRDLLTSADINSVEHFRGCELAAVKYFGNLKERFHASWIKLSAEVYNLHTSRPDLSDLSKIWDGLGIPRSGDEV
ncbi:hypothetical protein EDB19DRAFT_1916529 [Suillus lakei]|nr:hypothetical protein EDB19DRAFT_1916529 [Suillus lakei]